MDDDRKEDGPKKDGRKRRGAADFASEAGGTGAEAAADGCLGCDINLLVALTLLAGVPMILWAI